MEMLIFCLKDLSYFKFENKLYGQQKGMPLSSSLTPVLADIVMEELLDTTTEKMNVKPKILTKYVNNLFAIIKKSEVENTLGLLKSHNKGIQFTMKQEIEGRLSYLETVVIKQDNKLVMDYHFESSLQPKSSHAKTGEVFAIKVLTISDREFHENNKKKIRLILKVNKFSYGTTNGILRCAEDRVKGNHYKMLGKMAKPNKVKGGEMSQDHRNELAQNEAAT
ncbi:uncharacterized protein LOC106081830 [Stomoxys calcitrans]|uniref:uncharacterized protein LOC106081830 n=1 Tax=Stomoxys calcitrans TaxID=35570 RepID=UPI0027E2A828|nr:uncharacterized protein LOC106081830 [Stomoxys calcitrans]XP_059220769.1 uncharacterized protein LOC106081830 [Stomoxys calcitrans]